MFALPISTSAKSHASRSASSSFTRAAYHFAVTPPQFSYLVPVSHRESRELRKQRRLNRFDRRLWRRFLGTAKPYWFSDEKWVARGLLALLVLLLIGETEFSVFFNEQSGEFTSALAPRDPARFWP